MIFLKIIYYLGAVIFFIGSFVKLFHVEKYVRYLTDKSKYDKLKNLTKKKNVADAEENDPDGSELAVKTCLLMGYTFANLVWLLVGLFTFNYQFIILGWLFSAIISKIFYGKSDRFSTGKIVYMRFALVYWMIFYLFMILNSFHFHYQIPMPF